MISKMGHQIRAEWSIRKSLCKSPPPPKSPCIDDCTLPKLDLPNEASGKSCDGDSRNYRLMTMSSLYPCSKPCSRGTHNETVTNLALFSSIMDLLQVSLLINKQTGGKKKKKREGKGGGGGERDLWTKRSENEARHSPAQV